MQDNIKKLALYGVLISVIITAGIFYWWNRRPTARTKQEATADSTLQIKQDVYTKVTNVSAGKSALSDKSPGFGRNNPFAPYK